MNTTLILALGIALAVGLILIVLGRTWSDNLRRVDWRSLLARLPLPMLALAASYGVYSFAALFVPWPVAIAQAAAFELTYIGLAVTRGLGADQRRRATAISIGAVVASIVYNTLAGWFHRQPELLIDASPIAWLMFAILHGAPLAWVAYLVADLLLHTTVRPRAAHRAALARVLWRMRGEVRAARDARASMASSDAMLAEARAELAEARAELAQALRDEVGSGQLLAQARVELAEARAELAQAQHAAAQHQARAAQLEREAEQQARERRAELREYEQTAAQLRAELVEARASAALDIRVIARRFADAGVSSREIATLIGVPESTLRGWRKAATNGHAVEAAI